MAIKEYGLFTDVSIPDSFTEETKVTVTEEIDCGNLTEHMKRTLIRSLRNQFKSAARGKQAIIYGMLAEMHGFPVNKYSSTNEIDVYGVTPEAYKEFEAVHQLMKAAEEQQMSPYNRSYHATLSYYPHEGGHLTAWYTYIPKEKFIEMYNRLCKLPEAPFEAAIKSIEDGIVLSNTFEVNNHGKTKRT